MLTLALQAGSLYLKELGYSNVIQSMVVLVLNPGVGNGGEACVAAECLKPGVCPVPST